MADQEVKLKDLGAAVEPIIKAQHDIQEALGNLKDGVQKSVTNYEALEKKFDAELDKMNKLIEARLKSSAPAVDELAPLEGPLKAQNSDVYYESPDRKFVDVVKGADLLFTHNLLASARRNAAAKASQGMRLEMPGEPSERLKSFYKAYTERFKSYTETGSGTGDEIVPLFMRPQLWKDVFVSSRVASQFERFNMPSNPFDLPLDFAEATFSKIAELGSPSADDAATRNVRGTVTKLLNLKKWSYELSETAIIALAPALRANVLRGANRYIDYFLMSADSTNDNTNINTDGSPAAADYFLSAGQDGIRHVPLVDATGQQLDVGGKAVSLSHVSQVLGKMGEYGVDAENLRIFPGVKTYLQGLRMLPENVLIPNSRLAGDSVIRTGQAGLLLGAPVIPTPSVELAKSNGKKSATAGNNTLGAFYVAHANMILVGYVRDITVEMDVNIQTQEWIMVTSFRLAIFTFGARASTQHIAGAFNIGF